METKETIYSEVSIDFYNEINHTWSVDTWKTSNPNEEGEVVARINLKGEILWEVEEAKNDPYVKEHIEEFFKYRYFSAKDDSDKLFDIVSERINDLYVNDYHTYHIYSEDGETEYGIEKTSLLEHYVYVVGMMGNGNLRVFNTDEADEAINWFAEDVSVAVGEVFVVDCF